MQTLGLWTTEALNNPYYPLPRDYPTLTTEGRRLARSAVIHDQSTPANFVRAWSFFCSYYLWPSDTGFFKRHKPPARLHYCMVHDLARYPLNMYVAPRSAAKTTVLTKSIPLLLAYTRPNFSVWTVMAKMGLISHVFDEIKIQIEENPYLYNDYGKIGGRGCGIWSAMAIRLSNKFRMVGLPITGRNRGPRPDLLLLDDVENDPENPKSGPALTAKLEDKLTRVYLPMIDEGAGVFMIGTKVRANSFLERAVQSRDLRMQQWNRRSFNVVDDTGHSVWQAKWNQNRIEVMRNRLGEAFDFEMLNRSSGRAGKLFAFSDRFHTYRLGNPDELLESNPLSSGTIVQWNDRKDPATNEHTICQQPLHDLLRNQFRFLCVDFTKKVSHHADYSCALVMSADHQSRLWLWDLFLKQCTQEELTERILHLAYKWRVRVIGPESVAMQQRLTDIIQRAVDKRFSPEATGFVPVVFPVKYKYGIEKADRINNLEWRFSRDRILLPSHLLGRWPWKELHHQILNYVGNPDLLRHDDAIDTVAMSNEVLVNRRVATPITQPTRARMEHLCELADEDGTSPLSGLNASELTPEDRHVLLEHQQRRSRRSRLRFHRNGSEREDQYSPADIERMVRQSGINIVGIGAHNHDRNNH